MSIWFFIVMVIGIGYALNRLTSTTDLPVSTRLAQAREIVEQGRLRRTAGPPVPRPTAPPVVRPTAPPVAPESVSRPALGVPEQPVDRRAA